MRFLFVCNKYANENDAIGTCIRNLREELNNKYKIKSDVIAFAWSEGSLEYTDSYGNIYLTTGTIANIEKRFNNISMLEYVVRKFLARSICGFADRENNQPSWMLKNLTQWINVNANNYDLVVTCSWPFCIQTMMLKCSNEIKRKWVMLQFDPYSTNRLLKTNKAIRNRREKKEQACISQAQKLICLPEQEVEFRASLPKMLYEKIGVITVPNSVNGNTNIFPSEQKLNLDNNYINCCYCGGFYSKIRRPDFLFEFLRNTQIKVRFYFIGNFNSLTCKKIINPYKDLIGSKVFFIEQVSHEEISGFVENFDILLNLGNSIENQVPSKVFEYMATGKPILNVCYNNKCSSLPYLTGYPCLHNIFQDKSILIQKDDTESFLLANKGMQFKEQANHFSSKYSIAKCTEKFLNNCKTVLLNQYCTEGLNINERE